MAKVFVTGGTGFVGQPLIKALVSKGHIVTALTRSNDSTKMVESMGASAFLGDVTDPTSLQHLPRFDWAFHVAGSMDHTIGYRALHRINVIGTRNIITALQNSGTPRLIHLSTFAVLADGSVITNADECRPLPKKNVGIYAETKAIAEKELLNAATARFEVIIVRPPLVWGNGDCYSLPKLSQYVRKNYFSWLDEGDYFFSTCHVENLAAGLVAAAERGRNREVYFIKDKEEVKLRQFLTGLLATQGLKEPKRSVSRTLVTAVCGLIELPWKVLPLKSHPPTHLRETVVMMGQPFTIRSRKAEQELSFVPPVSIGEGLTKMTKTNLH